MNPMLVGIHKKNGFISFTVQVSMMPLSVEAAQKKKKKKKALAA